MAQQRSSQQSKMFELLSVSPDLAQKEADALANGSAFMKTMNNSKARHAALGMSPEKASNVVTTPPTQNNVKTTGKRIDKDKNQIV